MNHREDTFFDVGDWDLISIDGIAAVWGTTIEELFYLDLPVVETEEGLYATTRREAELFRRQRPKNCFSDRHVAASDVKECGTAS